MGKSDPHVFNFYFRNIDLNKKYKSVGFFGQSRDNSFTNLISAEKKTFFDLSIGNWNINEFPYHNQSFDLIICTRCAYFCKSPLDMIRNFYECLEEKGTLFLDWGLGDHWRFDEYRVGWKNKNDHEWAYQKDNFLWSCLWEKQFTIEENVIHFSKQIKKFGYNDLHSAVIDEIPSIVTLEDVQSQGFEIVKFDTLYLWPTAPQLYLLLNLRKIK
jgi:SAM-dependent methyltransferase